MFVHFQLPPKHLQQFFDLEAQESARDNTSEESSRSSEESGDSFSPGPSFKSKRRHKWKRSKGRGRKKGARRNKKRTKEPVFSKGKGSRYLYRPVNKKVSRLILAMCSLVH